MKYIYVYYENGIQNKTNILYNLRTYIKISSPDDNTPALEDLETGYKEWRNKHSYLHRLSGPARIWGDGFGEFYLNGKPYKNIQDWLNNHPNPDLYFDVINLTETERVLWFLQN
jgi:hypothetical protein